MEEERTIRVHTGWKLNFIICVRKSQNDLLNFPKVPSDKVNTGKQEKNNANTYFQLFTV